MEGKRKRTVVKKSAMRQHMDELCRAIRRLWPEADCVAREDQVLVINENGTVKGVKDMMSAMKLLGDPFKLTELQPLSSDGDDFDGEPDPTPTNSAA